MKSKQLRGMKNRGKKIKISKLDQQTIYQLKGKVTHNSYCLNFEKILRISVYFFLLCFLGCIVYQGQTSSYIFFRLYWCLKQLSCMEFQCLINKIETISLIVSWNNQYEIIVLWFLQKFFMQSLPFVIGNHSYPVFEPYRTIWKACVLCGVQVPHMCLPPRGASIVE